MEENTQLPKEVVIPADKVAFMKESIEKLRAANQSDYKSGEFDSFNHKNEGRYNAFEEVLQWANPLKFYEEEKEILLEEITNLSKELQEKDAQLQDAKEKIKVLTYDNNKLKGEVEGLKNAVEELKRQTGAVWVKASERLPGWRQSVKWKSHEGAEVGKHPLFAMTDPGTAEAMDGWEWLDESAAGREENSRCSVFVPCTEDDPDCCGGYTSNDGQSLCYVKEALVPLSAFKQKEK